MSVLRDELQRDTKRISELTRTVAVYDPAEALLWGGNNALMQRHLGCAFDAYLATLTYAEKLALLT